MGLLKTIYTEMIRCHMGWSCFALCVSPIHFQPKLRQRFIFYFPTFCKIPSLRGSTMALRFPGIVQSVCVSRGLLQPYSPAGPTEQPTKWEKYTINIFLHRHRSPCVSLPCTHRGMQGRIPRFLFWCHHLSW